MTRICAITGSNGYVGGCVKRRFDTSGWDTFELTRRPVEHTRGRRFRLGDALPPQALSGFAALIHCAYDFQALRWDEIRAVNVEGSRKVLESARAAGIPKIVFISSISAFEGCRSLYGKAKLEIEAIAEDNGALVIRPGLVYGSHAGGMFGRLVEQINHSFLVPMVGGSRAFFLLHHEDLSAFIERYCSDDGGLLQDRPILTAAHERPWPFEELLRHIAAGLQKTPAFIPLPWQAVWFALTSAERFGLRLGLRSDNVISLMNPNPAPDFSPNARVGLVCRPFAFPPHA